MDETEGRSRGRKTTHVTAEHGCTFWTRWTPTTGSAGGNPMTRWFAAGAAALALVACGGDDDTGPLDDLAEMYEAAEAAAELPCAEVFAAGRPTDEVVTQVNADDYPGCTDEAGEWVVTGFVSWDCPDGRTVYDASAVGWGFSGDVWQAPGTPVPYADCVLPGTDAHHP